MTGGLRADGLTARRDGPLRVLFWSELFWPYIGGAEIIGAKLAMSLRERGCEVTVVTRQDTPAMPAYASFHGVPVYRFPFVSALANGDVAAAAEARKAVIELKRRMAPDLVHIHSFGPSALFHLDTAAAPSPLIVTIHKELPPEAFASGTLLERTLRRADRVTCVSRAVLAATRARLPEVTTYSSVVYNGLDAPRIAPAPLPFEAPRILCLGRLIPEKGFDLALSAFAVVLRRVANARLLIAGDGPARSALEHQATELGVAAHVEFLGWVAPDSVASLMNRTTVVVVPSRWSEPFCLVALEAALMSRPTVATAVGGLPEIIVHDQTGLLVAMEDRRALADAIVFLLEHPDAATRMGAAAHVRARDTFASERQVDAYERLYRALVGPETRRMAGAGGDASEQTKGARDRT
jgi:glycogen(starch) synthase